MAKTVYAVNLSDRDYSSGEAFGEIIFMTKGVLDLRKHEQYEEKIRNYLSKAQPDDLLLFSGPSLICALALKIWYEFNVKCNVLYWERNQYTLYEL